MSHHQQAASPGPQLTLARLMLLGAAFATGGAGVVHLDAAGDHSEHAFVAAFFVTAGLAQLALAVALGQRTPHRLAIPAALAVNIGLLVTWALSRTVGLDALPLLGSVPGVVGTEPVGTKDLATAGLELMALLLVGLASAAPAAAGTALLIPTAARASLAGLLAIALALTVPGVLASHDASHHEADGHGDLAAAHPHEGGEHPADHPHGGDGHQGHEGHADDDHADHGGDDGTHDDHGTTGGHLHSTVSHGDHNTGSHGEHGSGGHGNHGDGPNHGDHNDGGNHGDHGDGGNHGDHGDGGHDGADHGEHPDHEVAAEPNPLAGPGRISTVRVGPIGIPPSLPIDTPHTSPLLPMIAPGKVNLLPILGIKPPCTDCFILGAKPDLVYEDGSEANLDTGPMLHHTVVMDPSRKDPICPQSAPGLLGERVFAAGNERTGLAMPKGYGVPHGDGPFAGAIELMNTSPKFKKVYFELKLRWVPQSTPGIKPLRPLWFDIDSCGDSEENVDAGVNDINWDWTSNVTGRLVAAGGHLHDGGEWLALRNDTSGEHLCTSVAGYGHDPAYLGSLESMSTCSWDSLGSIRKGDRLELKAHYNTSKPQKGVMGIMMGFLYETNDLHGGQPSPYPSKPPPDGAPADGGHQH